MKIVCFLMFFILISPLFAQSAEGDNTPSAAEQTEFFTFDDWLGIYREGLSGELEDLPDLEIILFDEEPTVNEEAKIAEEDLIIEAIEEEYLVVESVEGYNWVFEGDSFIYEVPVFETRSFDDLFPEISRREKLMIMGGYGLRYFFTKDESPSIIPNPDSGIDLLSSVMSRRPSHLIESLLVVPYEEKELDLLDIYNALGRIENIKDYYIPHTQGNYYVFTESSRITSSRNRRPIPDPLPAETLPFSETIYLRLRENSIGNLFLKGDISVSNYGITYNMTNFAGIWYFIVPVMGEERFSTVIYLEPVKEGVLIYCIVGFYIPNFVANRVDLTPSINRRIQVFINWITDGLRLQEQLTVNNEQ